MSTTGLTATLAVPLLCLLLSGCGAVGEPRPPLLNIPERADDFTARQTPEGIVLEWTWPRVTTEGVLLNDLDRFDIYGFELAPGSPLPDAGQFERESRPLAMMRGADLAPYNAGERVRFALDPKPLQGKWIALGVRAESRRGRSVGFSNLALVQVTAPPGQPERPSLTLTPAAVVVEWPAVDRASAYVVERSSAAAGRFEEIGRPAGASFRDSSFQIGETYAYRVRAIAGAAAGQAEGPASETAAITPRDVFAPGKPAGLRAVATETSVELAWEQNAEPDLKGYRVRRRQQGAEPVLLTEALLESASYSDHEVARGQQYAYEVTAVDGNSNESEPSEETTVRVP